MDTQSDTQCNPVDALMENTFENGPTDENMFDTHTQPQKNMVCHTSQLSHEKKRKRGLLVGLKWSAEDTEKLISEVKLQPCLWNRSCEEKRNLKSRNVGWAAVAGTFQNIQITAKDCNAKWQSLRTVQRSVVRRNEATSWRFFHQMSFVLLAEGYTMESRLVNLIPYVCIFSS